MKKKICFIMIVCLILLPLASHADAGFSKASDWAVEELKIADACNLIPESIQDDMSKAITRKEFAEVCVRLYELTTNTAAEPAAATTFSDTQHIDVLKAFHLGIVTGIGEGKFGPDLTTNREQIATMLKRLIHAISPVMNSFQPDKAAYDDKNQISSWALESVDFVTEYGFVTGWNSLFAPKGECTREMAVIIAKRVYEYYNAEVPLDETALQKTEILRIAEKYYDKTIPAVEKRDEFQRVISFAPDFSGETVDPEKARELSFDAAQLITFTNAKNMYVAFSAALFALSPESAAAANNLACAIATYNDEMIGLKLATDESYQDALNVYRYALQKSKTKKDGKLTADSPGILVSLGNLYLDTNQFQQAYAAFQTAYQFDRDFFGAKLGLVNYYLAKGDKENANKLLDGLYYPAIAQGVAKIEQEQPDVTKLPLLNENASEGELEAAMIKNFSIPIITAYDFYTSLDPAMSNDAKLFMNGLKGKLQLKAPEIAMITQHTGLQRISSPSGQSATTSFFTGLSNLKSKMTQAEAKASSSQPELKILQCNPYEYANYVDILVQNYHVSALQRKMNILPFYANKVNTRVSAKIDEQVKVLEEQLEVIDKAEKIELEKLAYTLGGMEMSAEAKTRRLHMVHEEYRVQRNGVKNIAYNELTAAADEAYLKKVKYYAEKVYQDCMGHIMLITDQDVRKSLEDRLHAQVLRALYDALDHVLLSRKVIQWEDPFEKCGCPLPEQAEEERRIAAEQELASKEHASNDETARKLFEFNELSTHSPMYEKALREYGAEITTISFNGSIRANQSGFSVNIGLNQDSKSSVVQFGNMSGYFRNATTVDGGFIMTAKEYSSDLVGKLAVFVGANLVNAKDGSFSLHDISIFSKGAVNAQNKLSSAIYRVDAFAIRGSRFHALAVVSGNARWDEHKQAAMKKWPEMQLKNWDGQY
jgi:hypothetical protein